MRVSVARIGLAAALLLSSVAATAVEARSSRYDDDLPRRTRCRLDPFAQGCMTLSAGVSIGTVGNDALVGLGAGVGAFALKRLHVGVDGSGAWKLTGSDLARYDVGLGTRYYIGPVGNLLIVPGYRGGRFWQRGLFDFKGWIHGPRVSLSSRLSSRVFFGVAFAYDFVHIDNVADTQTEWSLAPALTVAF